MMHRTWLWLAGAALVSLIGCKTATRAPGASDDYFGSTPTCIDHDGDGFGLNCPLGADCDDSNATVTIGCYICDHPSPGCPCSTENARTQCGTLTGQEGTQSTCSYGESVCSGGTWGACGVDGKTVKTFNSAKRTQGLAFAAPCSGDPCDPYCQQFPDTPDDTLSTPEGLLGTDAGLTLEQSDAHIRPYLPNGPMPGYIQSTLKDGGIFADAQPDAMIYHELPPAVAAQDTVAGTNDVPPRSIDVYFLENNAGTMKLTEQAVLATVPVAGGTVDQVHATVPDARFGVGRFGTYGQTPWNFGLGSPTVAFEHVLSPTIDTMQLTTGLQYAVTKNIVAGANPRTWVQALFSIATTGGLPSSNAASPWVLARADWTSPIGTGEAGPCANGGVGYPCFRPSASAIPVTVVLTDTPSLNGPGGQYAIYRNSAWNVDGAKYWPAGGIPVTGNSTEATAYVIDPTVWASYAGNTTDVGNVKNSKWDGGNSSNECVVDRGLNARNEFFTFTLTQRTWYHFDVQASFNAVPYLYKKVGATVTWIACNEALSLGDPQFMPLSLNGVLDPGQYYLVVDGNSGAEGAYQLHVNAMPDGSPFAAPNYDEALAAYTAIGGKVVGVDASGYGCNVAPHVNVPNWMQQNTGNSLEKLLLDTGSVDGGNNPYLISLSNWGDACHAGDPAFATKLAQDILDVTGPGRAVATRGDVTAVVLDSDDDVDFDGPPGGPNQLTPMNVDDATFVTSITTVSTPETLANCTQVQANQYVGCTTGTPVTFVVNIQTPATIPLLYHDQIFTFVVRILANGTRVLSETPVVVVVPALWPYLSDAWFVRDFDTTTVCPLGTAPVWGTWAWQATTPLDSRIDFDISVASTPAGLSAPGNPIDSLLFSSSPMSLVGTAIGAARDNGGISTQLGATYVDWTLANPPAPAPAGTIRARDSKALRIRSHLIPTSDNQFAPTLKTWNLSVSCRPAE